MSGHAVHAWCAVWQDADLERVEVQRMACGFICICGPAGATEHVWCSTLRADAACEAKCMHAIVHVFGLTAAYLHSVPASS